jgi:hypothetical protein
VGSKMKQLKKKQIEEHYLAHNIYKVWGHNGALG